MLRHLKRTFVLASFTLLAGATVASAQPGGGRPPIVNPGNPNLPIFVGPSEGPPPLRNEKRGKAKRGMVYVEGRWDWQNGKWMWVAGRWEKERPGKRWQAGRWEKKGDRFEWMADVWIDLPQFPTSAPPPAKVERPGRAKRGMVWVEGKWDWQNGGYVWIAGRWEKQQSGKRWRRGEWQQRGDRWEWSSDGWEDAPLFPTAAPPTPQHEPTQRPRKGYVWVAGNYDWKDGNYTWVAGHWERSKANQTWVAGQWSQRGNRWEWTAGHWQ